MMSTHPTQSAQDQGGAPDKIGAEVPVATFRDNFSAVAKRIEHQVAVPLIRRLSRGEPSAPAYVMPYDLWTAICDELPTHRPDSAHTQMGPKKFEEGGRINGRNARKALSRKILLPAWNKGIHTEVAADDGEAYHLMFVPPYWWDNIPGDVKQRVIRRIRATRPKR